MIMIQWQHLFRAKALADGKELFKQRKVKLKELGNNEFYADVTENEERFTVLIDIGNSKPTFMSCSCSAGGEKINCRHLAAVFYEMSEDVLKNDRSITKGMKQKEQKDALNEQVFPFSHSDTDGVYRYFQMDRMTENFTINRELLDLARKRMTCSTPPKIRLEESYYTNGEPAIIARAEFTETNHVCMVELCASKSRFTFMSCTHSHCRTRDHRLYYGGIYGSEKREPCEHCLGVMLALNDYLKKNSCGDYTDKESRYALEQLLRIQKKEQKLEKEGLTAEGREVFLEPRLKKDRWDDMMLSFRIGAEEKQYVVKNLIEMTNLVNRREKMTLGTRLTLDFSSDYLSEASVPFFDLVERYVRDMELRAENEGYMASSVNAIPMQGSVLDEVYDLCCGKSLPAQTDNSKNTTNLHIIDGDPQLELNIRDITDKDGVFHGVQVTGDLPNLLKGAKYYYSVDNTSLHRLSVDAQKLINSLLIGTKGNQVNITVGRNMLTSFYQDILPELQKSVLIKEKNKLQIQQYLPAEAEFGFYMDVEDGVPICSPRVRYGESEYRPVNGLNTEITDPSQCNLMREKEVLRKVREYFPARGSHPGELICGYDPDEIYRAVTEGVSALWNLGTVFATDAFNNISRKRHAKIQIGVSVDCDIMDLSIASDLSMQELLDVLNSYQLKKKYHRLKSGEFVEMDTSIEELSDLMETLHLTPKEMIQGKTHIPAYRALYLDRMLESCEEIYANRDKYFKKLIKEFKTVKDSDFDVPEGIEKILRNYQVFGYKWLRTLGAYGFGGILADDMGLGKTLQTIAVLTAEREEGNLGTSLVVCPASLVFNWAEEFRRFSPSMKVGTVVGNQTERREMLERYAEYDVLVTSYDLLKRDIVWYEEILFLYEVIDEAQFIKNHSTAAAKAVKIIRSKHRLALTGTPIENRLSELWSIFDFLMPGFLYGYETFRKELETPITKKQDKHASERLRRMISPFILRRLKTDVLKDLPEKTEETRIVRFEDTQRQLYDARVANMKQLLAQTSEEEMGKSRILVLAELTKIRQLCCDPSLLVENYSGESCKREACMDLVESAIAGEHRILIFSQFTSMLELLKKDLENRHLAYYEITGATPKQERVRLVNEFNGGTVPVFLISLKAGGTGLNLTGADIVIHYDPWWNAAAQNQATDRAHRIGQTKPVTVYKIIIKDSIEEKIQKMQELKMNLADEIISGEMTSLGSLSKEELLELLS